MSNSGLPTVRLKKGREKALERRHPWIFSGAVHSTEGDPQNGDTVRIVSNAYQLLGVGSWAPQSQIQLRVWSFDPDETIDANFFRRHLKRAIEARELLHIDRESTAIRLVNAESDNLPGLVVDRYGDLLVCQFQSAGISAWKSEIVSLLEELQPGCTIYDRSDADFIQKEGLEPHEGVLSGEAPDQAVEIEEHGLRYLVDFRNGQKSGFYLDQRDNRRLVAGWAKGKRVLNAFAYTGGFGIAAQKQGAKHVTHIETSAQMLDLAKRNTELNGLNTGEAEFIEGNVFGELRRFRKEERTFDMVVLDPPKFMESKGQLHSASRGYKDINLLACQLLEEGGLLATFSSSGLLDPDLFQKIVADAALDAGRHVQIMHWMHQAPDHPVSLNFPEANYLKGLLCRVW